MMVIGNQSYYKALLIGEIIVCVYFFPTKWLLLLVRITVPLICLFFFLETTRQLTSCWYIGIQPTVQHRGTNQWQPGLQILCTWCLGSNILAQCTIIMKAKKYTLGQVKKKCRICILFFRELSAMIRWGEHVVYTYITRGNVVRK